jgi:hypothetical protein
MKKIALINGGHTLVDDEDYDHFKDDRWFWLRLPGGNTKYVIRRIQKPDGTSTKEYLHRLIMGLSPGDPEEVDHRNRKGLDNQRDNLRVLTVAQNQQNTIPRSDCTSGCRGVHKHHGAGKWRAKIDHGGKRVHLGLYDTKWEACEAYNIASKALHQYGRQNKIPQGKRPTRKERRSIHQKVNEYLEANADLETLA